jgi:hypothetical protein
MINIAKRKNGNDGTLAAGKKRKLPAATSTSPKITPVLYPIFFIILPLANDNTK